MEPKWSPKWTPKWTPNGRQNRTKSGPGLALDLRLGPASDLVLV